MKRITTLLGAAAILALGTVASINPAKAEPPLFVPGVAGGILGAVIAEDLLMTVGYEAQFKADGLTVGERICRNGWHGIGFLVPDSCVNGHSVGLPTPPVGYNASHPSATAFKPGPY